MLFRHSRRDVLLLSLALLQGGVVALLLARSPGPGGALLAAPLLAALIWWSSNTISHNHLHAPLFRWRWQNRLFSLYLTLLLSVPQGLWRARHLWHHAGEPPGRRPRLDWQGRAEIGLVALLWAGLLAQAPPRFLFIYLPGYLLGMLLCLLQGHYEHASPPVRSGPAGISYYGRLYNWIWFNDGYHAEHHRYPGEHWSRLPPRRLTAAATSPLPPLLRWAAPLLPGLRRRVNRVQARALVLLERTALRDGPIQRFMLRSHERAFSALLGRLPGRPPARVAIVGGGLFPRTALVLARLLPGSELIILDRELGHLALARQALAARAPWALPRVTFLHLACDPARGGDFDLFVVPLGYVGDRDALYRGGGPPMLIHDWIWRARGQAGVPISLLLLKRLNLVEGG